MPKHKNLNLARVVFPSGISVLVEDKYNRIIIHIFPETRLELLLTFSWTHHSSSLSVSVPKAEMMKDLHHILCLD